MVYKFSGIGRAQIHPTYTNLNLNKLTIRTDGSDPQKLKDPSCAVESAAVECIFKNLEQRLITEIYKHKYVFGCVAWLTHLDILSAFATREGVCVVVQKEDFLRPDGGGGPYKDQLRQAYKKLPSVFKFTEGFELVDRLNVCADTNIDAVRCCGLGGRDTNRPRCHHKFLVFCDYPQLVEDKVPGSWKSSGDASPDWAGIEDADLRDTVWSDAACIQKTGLCPKKVWTGSFNFTKNAVQSFENAVIISDEMIARAYMREFEQIVALSEELDWASEYVAPEYRIGT